MKSNLTTTEKKLIEKISQKQRTRPEDWLIMHLQEEYQRLYKRPFNG
jgi:Leu/Phe-tRNA-protein transferase